MTMQYLQDQHMLVLGLGASGLAMARWGVRCGARVTVADTRSAPPQLAALQRDVPGAQFVCGALDATLLQSGSVTAIYKSPGLSPADIDPLLIAAKSIGISARGELGLFWQALQVLHATQAYQPAVLAVTGTNGKTTVTALTGQLVARTGKSVAVAGNIGPTLLDTLAQHIDAGTLPQVWVLELSSFQLDGEHEFEPTAQKAEYDSVAERCPVFFDEIEDKTSLVTLCAVHHAKVGVKPGTHDGAPNLAVKHAVDIVDC